MKKGILITGIVLLLTGTTLLIYQNSKKGGETPSPDNDNFDKVKTNLGSAGRHATDSSIDTSFNGNKNVAKFYNNSRVIIYTSAGKEISKGSYSNGGLTITIDGKDPITSASVFENLNKTI